MNAEQARMASAAAKTKMEIEAAERFMQDVGINDEIEKACREGRAGVQIHLRDHLVKDALKHLRNLGFYAHETTSVWIGLGGILITW
jgi:hypothetical protein